MASIYEFSNTESLKALIMIYYNRAAYNPFAATKTPPPQPSSGSRISKPWLSVDQSPKSTPKAKKLAPKQVFAVRHVEEEEVIEDTPQIEDYNSENVENEEASENIIGTL